jgi:hypothetical protein
MGCSICGYLEQAYEAVLAEYIEARSSVRYRVSTVLAAQKNVDMERARYELEEHQRVCASAIIPAILVSREAPGKIRRIAA